ncbi:MAG: hypothetical protein CMI30_01465 [Opitutae bacterium]|nr:hypothetical protein [Opitutae bacterium]
MSVMPTHWLSENDTPGSTTAVLLGPVDATELKTQCEKHPAGVLWIAVEGDAQAPSLPPSNLTQVMVNASGGHFPQETLQDFLGLNYEVMPSVRVSSAINPDSPVYLNALNLVMQQTEATLRARRTRSETGPLRQQNVFRNLPGYLQARVPGSWRGAAEGSLAVVVGAGPSLDVTLPLLVETCSDAVVIAADSAIKALAKHGVSPDLVVNMDPEKTLASCDSSTLCPGIAVLSSQSHPSWRAAWRENVRYLSGRVLTEDWLAVKGVAKTDLLAVNNAGLSAFLLADYLEASVVLLAGMDLSGSDDGKRRYAESTGRNAQVGMAAHYKKIPGNHEDTVSTPFLSDWSETNEHCAAIARRRQVVNLNDRGARLEGSTLIHPDKFEELENALSENLTPFDRTGNKLSQEQDRANSWDQALRSTLANRCDEIGRRLQPLLSGTHSRIDKLRFLRELMANQELATLLGDFSFAVMPGIMPGKEPSESQLDLWLRQLRQTLWILEDALLENDAPEEFLRRFLAESLTS